jgi:hypothetical protein
MPWAEDPLGFAPRLGCIGEGAQMFLGELQLSDRYIAAPRKRKP